MNIVLEGCLLHAIVPMLNYYIDEKNKLTLSTLNEKISSFLFFLFPDSKKPSQIMSHHIKKVKKLCQSASQMLQLARILPFVLSEFVDCSCDTYQCFIALLKFINILLSPNIVHDALTLFAFVDFFLSPAL